MVFFTSTIIVAILYFLQTDGVVYVVFVALIAELINLLLANFIAKTVEKKIQTKANIIINRYKKEKNRIETKLDEYHQTHEEYASAIYEAKTQIKENEKLIKTLKAKTREQEERLNRYDNLPRSSSQNF
ncbi:MAG: hypothetical protein U9N77_06920 [Thermodesulfobacteriota bacterium]|nr:hypothetical protein [Thermodesulfobacteriota bacterium]